MLRTAYAMILTAVLAIQELPAPPGAGTPDPGRAAVYLQPQQSAEFMDEDYEPVPLDRLVGTAQLIVSGEVTTVKKGTFFLRVARLLEGDPPPSEIEVVQFHPGRFEGIPRSAAYKPGQSFLLFLMTHPQRQRADRWKIIGAGGEGEMPVDGGFVYFHGRNVEGTPFGRYSVHGVERTIQRWDSAQFFDAVQRYRLCFQWTVGPSDRPRPRTICDEPTLQRYAQGSAIHAYLARLTKRRLENR